MSASSLGARTCIVRGAASIACRWCPGAPAPASSEMGALAPSPHDDVGPRLSKRVDALLSLPERSRESSRDDSDAPRPPPEGDVASL